LEWEVGVAWVLLRPHMVHQVLYSQRLIASLYPFEARLLHSQLYLQHKGQRYKLNCSAVTVNLKLPGSRPKFALLTR
jgi:hypothetical protein